MRREVKLLVKGVFETPTVFRVSPFPETLAAFKQILLELCRQSDKQIETFVASRQNGYWGDLLWEMRGRVGKRSFPLEDEEDYRVFMANALQQETPATVFALSSRVADLPLWACSLKNSLPLSLSRSAAVDRPVSELGTRARTLSRSSTMSRGSVFASRRDDCAEDLQDRSLVADITSSCSANTVHEPACSSNLFNGTFGSSFEAVLRQMEIIKVRQRLPESYSLLDYQKRSPISLRPCNWPGIAVQSKIPRCTSAYNKSLVNGRPRSRSAPMMGHSESTADDTAVKSKILPHLFPRTDATNVLSKLKLSNYIRRPTDKFPPPLPSITGPWVPRKKSGDLNETKADSCSNAEENFLERNCRFPSSNDEAAHVRQRLSGVVRNFKARPMDDWCSKSQGRIRDLIFPQILRDSTSRRSSEVSRLPVGATLERQPESFTLPLSKPLLPQALIRVSGIVSTRLDMLSPTLWQTVRHRNAVKTS